MTRKRTPFPEAIPERVGAIAGFIIPKSLTVRVVAWLATLPAIAARPLVTAEAEKPTDAYPIGAWFLRLEWAHPRGGVSLWWRVSASDVPTRPRKRSALPLTVEALPPSGAFGRVICDAPFAGDTSGVHLDVKDVVALLGEVSTP